MTDPLASLNEQLAAAAPYAEQFAKLLAPDKYRVARINVQERYGPRELTQVIFDVEHLHIYAEAN